MPTGECIMSQQSNIERFRPRESKKIKFVNPRIYGLREEIYANAGILSIHRRLAGNMSEIYELWLRRMI